MNGIRLVALALLTGTSAVATPALAQDAAPSWSIDAAASDVYVVIRNDTNASLARLGHDHVIYASTFSGDITWPEQAGGACSVEIRVPVQKLVVDPPGLRAKAGLDDNTIDDGQKDKLKANMWGRSQLDAESHPDVVFRSTSCPGGVGKVEVQGTLTIRGVSKPLTATLDVTVSDGAFRARGGFKTTHEAHGFKPFQGSPFGPRNQETLSFSLDVRATR